MYHRRLVDLVLDENSISEVTYLETTWPLHDISSRTTRAARKFGAAPRANVEVKLAVQRPSAIFVSGESIRSFQRFLGHALPATAPAPIPEFIQERESRTRRDGRSVTDIRDLRENPQELSGWQWRRLLMWLVRLVVASQAVVR